MSLLHKHQEAKNRVDSLNVGGGISIWPDMNDMRLTNRDVALLISAGLLLCLATIFLFDVLHGTASTSLMYSINYLSKLLTYFDIDYNVVSFTLFFLGSKEKVLK